MTRDSEPLAVMSQPELNEWNVIFLEGFRESAGNADRTFDTIAIISVPSTAYPIAERGTLNTAKQHKSRQVQASAPHLGHR